MTSETPHSPTTEIELARLFEKVDALKSSFEAEKIASKEALTTALSAAEKATAAALAAQKESAAKTEDNAQKQLEMHNGLIRKMDNLVASFPTKDSVAKDLASRDIRLSSLEKAVARAYGAAAAAGALSGIALFLAQ